MAKYQRFEDLPVWQTAARLYNAVLDLFEADAGRFSPGYRNQLDRAALSVSNNIAEGFDRITTAELILFLGYARGSASEVRSMGRVVMQRPDLRPVVPRLREIGDLAESCIRQIAAWVMQIEEGTVQGKRHLTGGQKRERKAKETVNEYREKFLRTLPVNHPLYHTPEARRARGEEGEQ